VLDTIGKKGVSMKSEAQIIEAIQQCETAQIIDDPKLCPIYPDEEALDCVSCTCRDAFIWILKGK
jgi:hypothetical protein